jgi:hypothetical protein
MTEFVADRGGSEITDNYAQIFFSVETWKGFKMQINYFSHVSLQNMSIHGTTSAIEMELYSSSYRIKSAG